MKFFILGCSFTRYFWPTWADILEYSNPDIDVINIAKPGIGNVRMYYRLQELYLKNLIGPEDKVAIIWTSWHREDRFVYEQWTNQGNVFGAEDFGHDFAVKYWSEEYDIIKNCSAIIAANQLHSIDFNGSMMRIAGMESYDGDMIFEDAGYDKFHTDYDHYKKNLPEFVRFDHSTNTFFDQQCNDKHPDIRCHLDYYEKLRKVVGSLKEPDINKWSDVQRAITEGIHPSLSGNKLHEKIMAIVRDVHDVAWKTKIMYDGKWNDPMDLKT